jgi:hypothetical protein
MDRFSPVPLKAPIQTICIFKSTLTIKDPIHCQPPGLHPVLTAAHTFMAATIDDALEGVKKVADRRPNR